jgi:hypothetical protein
MLRQRRSRPENLDAISGKVSYDEILHKLELVPTLVGAEVTRLYLCQNTRNQSLVTSAPTAEGVFGTSLA